MNTIEQKQNEIIEEFSLFEDWMSKYEYLIELGKKLEPIDDKYKTDEYLVKGCASRAWIYPEYKDGKLYFYADGEAVISKGFLYLLKKIFSGHSPKEIIDADVFFVDKIGFKQHLSPTRANGLLASILHIKNLAKKFVDNQ